MAAPQTTAAAARPQADRAVGGPPTARPPSSILEPFPAWKNPTAETNEAQSTSPRAVRSLHRSPSAQSSAHSASPPPPARPKRFNLKDGVQEAMTTIKEMVDRKEIMIAEALYRFYSSEISLHFLHALSAYFILVAKDALSTRQQSLPEDTVAGSGGGGAGMRPSLREGGSKGLAVLEDKSGVKATGGGNDDGVRERAALLREVGKSYGRVVVYCSNFERTSADALFFESLLCLARLVVRAAVAEPSLSAEVDKEFDRILCGGVFHPRPLRPIPRHRRRSSRAMQLSQQRANGRAASPGLANTNFSTNPVHSVDNGNSNGRRNLIGSRGSGRGEKRGFVSKGIAGAASFVGEARFPTPPVGVSRTQSPVTVGGRGAGVGKKLGGVPTTKWAGDGDMEGVRGAEPTPSFDELSRWRVVLGSVPRMVRLAGEVQRVALSNLSLAQGYRRALALKSFKKNPVATATPTTPACVAADTKVMIHNRNGNNNDKHKTGNNGRNNLKKATPAQGQHINAVGIEAVKSQNGVPHDTVGGGPEAVRWRRKGRALTSGRINSSNSTAENGGGAGSEPPWTREFFNAEALSVCISSIVE